MHEIIYIVYKYYRCVTYNAKSAKGHYRLGCALEALKQEEQALNHFKVTVIYVALSQLYISYLYIYIYIYIYVYVY